MISRSLISLSLKTITRTSKESERFVNMIRKSNRTHVGRVNCRSKGLKSLLKLKPLPLSSARLRRNSLLFRKRNCSRLTNYLLAILSSSLKFSLTSILKVKLGYMSSWPIVFYSLRILSLDWEIGLKNWKEKKLILRKNKRIWIRNWQNWLNLCTNLRLK